MDETNDPQSEHTGQHSDVSEQNEVNSLRFESLEDASRNLSADVNALNTTLEVVADLQRRQQAQEQQNAETQAAVAHATRVANEREARTRFTMRVLAIGTGVLLILVATLVYLTLLQHVGRLLKEQNKTAYASCTQRNAGVMANADREDALAAAETNPALRKIHLDSARSQRASTIDCQKYLDRPT